MEVKSDYQINLYKRLGNNLIILYLLNLTDLFCTKILLYLAPDLFMEANMFLNPIIDGIMPYILKIGVIAIVLFYWYFRSKSSTEKELKRSVFVSKILFIVYGGINLLHIFNFILLLSTQ